MEYFRKFEISEFLKTYKIDPVRELMKLKNVISEENYNSNDQNSSGMLKILV